MSMKEVVRGRIAEHTGFDSVRDRLTEEILSAIRKIVEGKRKTIPNKTMLPYRYCKTYNSALDDILKELE